MAVHDLDLLTDKPHDRVVIISVGLCSLVDSFARPKTGLSSRSVKLGVVLHRATHAPLQYAFALCPELIEELGVELVAPEGLSEGSYDFVVKVTEDGDPWENTRTVTMTLVVEELVVEESTE